MEFIAVLFVGLPFAMAMVLAALFVLFLFAAFRSSAFGIGAILSVFLFNALFPGFGGINLGIRIDALDLVSLLLGLVALLRFLVYAEARHGLMSWYLFVLLVLASLAMGLAQFGTAGGVAARPYFYGIVTCSYVLTFAADVRLVQRLLTGMAWMSLVLFVLVVARWVITFLPIPALLPPEGRFSSVEASLLRVISAPEAMLIAQVVLVGLFYPAVVPALRWLRTAMPVLLLMVIALQHRSVWVALTAAIAARFALPQAGRRATVQLGAMALVLSVIAVPLLVSGKFGAATDDIGRAAGRAVAMADTVNFRFETWRFTIGKWASSGPAGLAIGLPMGTPMDRTVRTEAGGYSRVAVSAHNFYVQTLFNTGLLGMLAIAWVYGWVMLQLARGLKHPVLSDASGAMLLLLVGQLAYYVAYGVNFLQGMVLGVAAALALALTAQRRSTAGSTVFGIKPLVLPRSAL